LDGRWIVSGSKEAAESQMTEDEVRAGCILEQDPDVLDTWFSSGLLPLSTAGWRGNEGDQSAWEEYYPLTFIESGGDILFFWLARMAMLCEYSPLDHFWRPSPQDIDEDSGTWFSGKLPFDEILLHPMVCDAHGKKMSKSIGNVLDPMAVVEGRSWEQILQGIENDHKAELELWKQKAGGEQKLKALQKAIRSEIAEAKKLFQNGIPESGADPLRMALIDYTRQVGNIV
jgi:valyl-tRNA synthetase